MTAMSRAASSPLLQVERKMLAGRLLEPGIKGGSLWGARAADCMGGREKGVLNGINYVYKCGHSSLHSRHSGPRKHQQCTYRQSNGISYRTS